MKKKPAVILAIICMCFLLVFVVISGVLNMIESVSALKSLGYADHHVFLIIMACFMVAAVALVFVALWFKKQIDKGAGHNRDRKERGDRK